MKNFNYEDDDTIKNLNINESIELNNKKLNISGGIDPERIINKEYLSSLGDFYKCSICFKIMLNPKDCEGCGHSYCYECISLLNCPFGCKKKSIKNTSVGIINLLKNLKFKCINEGCDTIIPYEEVKKHDSTCDYQKIKCINKRCKKRILKKELENHIKNECKYSLIKCQYCKGEYFRKEINEHEKLCSITFQFLQNHKNGNTISEMNNTNNISNLNERYFNKYLQNLSMNISRIIKENKIIFETKKESKDSTDIKYKEENDKNTISEIKSNNNINNNIEESKASMAQIEEDDLIDIIKKALEEKIKNKFSQYDINFVEFCHYLDIIKGCVCQLNTIEEVQESDEDDDEEAEINKNINKKKNKNEFENINNIKENLKKIIDDSELKIKLSLSKLKDSMLNILKNKVNLNIFIKEENKMNFPDIEKILNIFSTKVNECIKETNENISKIYKQINSDKKETNIKNNNLKKDDSYKNNILNQIIIILENILGKNKDKEMNDIINEKNKNLKEIYEEKNNLIKKEINKSFKEYNDILKDEINKLSEEIGNIKEFINILKALINNKTNDIYNNIKSQSNVQKNNLIEEMIFKAFNQPKVYVRSRSKPIRTLQPHKYGIKNNINSNERKNSHKRIKSYEKKFNSTEDNLPKINEIKDHLKNKIRSHSSNSLYFKDDEKKDIFKDNDLFRHVLKIENKIKSIYDNLKLVPEQVKEKIFSDILNYFDKLKEMINKYFEEKIRNKLKFKYCKDCEKVECFYCFKGCYNCNNEYCLNNIILCRNCKQFICKECYQKVHNCN